MTSHNDFQVSYSISLPLRVLRAEGFVSVADWIEETTRCLAVNAGSSFQKFFNDRRIKNWKRNGTKPRISELRKFRDSYRLPPEWLRAGLTQFYTAAEGHPLPDDSEANLFFELLATPVGSDLEKHRRSVITARYLALPQRAALQFKGSQRGELVNVATEEMMYATTRYIPTLGIFARFGLDACRWGIIMYLSKEYYGALAPATRRLYSRVNTAMKRHRSVFGEDPADQQIAGWLNMSVDIVRDARRFHFHRAQKSLDAPIGDTGLTSYDSLAFRYTNAD